MAEITIDTERLRYVIFEKMKDPLSRELFLDQISALVDAVVSDLAPPRPVEPPSVVTASGWTVTWTGNHFRVGSTQYFKMAHDAARQANATEAEHDAIRALRDGPTARYEVCGWGVWKGDGAVVWWSSAKFGDRCEQNAREEASNYGGTAHAIYKRVGGA